MAGASHATAAVLTPGSATTRTKVNIAAALGQKVSPVWANFMKFYPAGPSGLREARTLKMLPASRRRQGVSSVHPQHGTKAWIRRLHKGHEAGWKLILAASSRSALAKSQRAEALFEAFTLSKKLRQQYHIVVPTFTWYALCTVLGISDWQKYLIATVSRSSALFSTSCTRAGPCLGA